MTSGARLTRRASELTARTSRRLNFPLILLARSFSFRLSSFSLSLFLSLCLSYASASSFLRLPPFPSLVSILTRLSYSSIQFLSSLPQFVPPLHKVSSPTLPFPTPTLRRYEISMNIYDGDSPPPPPSLLPSTRSKTWRNQRVHRTIPVSTYHLEFDATHHAIASCIDLTIVFERSKYR